MVWVQVSFEVREGAVETLETALELFGAVSVTLRDAEDQPLFEPPPGELPIWAHVKVTALFEEGMDLLRLKATLESAHPDRLSAWQIERLADQDWERLWMDGYEPMRFGGRLWIVPSHLEPPEPDAVNLILDPGLAFGTGTHATTALCLEWLDKYPPAGLSVLDFGCGSGVLGLAALKLGAKAVTGVDIDEQALLASRDNLERNQLSSEAFTLFYPGELTPGSSFDLVLANILAGPLVELVDQLISRLAPQGQLVLSGILDERAGDVVAAYQERTDVLDLTLDQGWARIWCRAKN